MTRVDYKGIGRLSGAFAMAFCLLFSLPGTAHATGCTAIAGKTPDEIKLLECPSLAWATPVVCWPNTNVPRTSPFMPCTYTVGSSYSASSGCGPITWCVLSGEDAPITNLQFDVSRLGEQGHGQEILSGRCAPPPTALLTVGPPPNCNSQYKPDSSVTSTICFGSACPSIPVVPVVR